MAESFDQQQLARLREWANDPYRGVAYWTPEDAEALRDAWTQ